MDKIILQEVWQVPMEDETVEAQAPSMKVKGKAIVFELNTSSESNKQTTSPDP